MKITIPHSQLTANPLHILRRAGYAYIRSRKTGQESYVRRLGSNFYPRLHLYVEETGGTISFNLHLDQKEASYAGSHAHNADYDGPVVEAEIERLKPYILGIPSDQPGSNLSGPLSKPRSTGLGREEQDTERKSIWRRLFG